LDFGDRRVNSYARGARPAAAMFTMGMFDQTILRRRRYLDRYAAAAATVAIPP